MYLLFVSFLEKYVQCFLFKKSLGPDSNLGDSSSYRLGSVPAFYGLAQYFVW